jgi:hypothetical protein
VKFLTITLIAHGPDPVTGERKSTTEDIAPVLRKELPSRPFPTDPAGR